MQRKVLAKILFVVRFLLVEVSFGNKSLGSYRSNGRKNVSRLYIFRSEENLRMILNARIAAKRFPRIAAGQQKSFLHPRSSTDRFRRRRAGLVTRASKNHARVNQSPVVCILRSIESKLGPSRPTPSGLESRTGAGGSRI